VCNIYQIASQFNCSDLKVQCLHFIGYRYDLISTTEGFKSLTNEDKQILAKHKKPGNYKLPEDEVPQKPKVKK